MQTISVPLKVTRPLLSLLSLMAREGLGAGGKAWKKVSDVMLRKVSMKYGFYVYKSLSHHYH